MTRKRKAEAAPTPMITYATVSCVSTRMNPTKGKPMPYAWNYRVNALDAEQLAAELRERWDDITVTVTE